MGCASGAALQSTHIKRSNGLPVVDFVTRMVQTAQSLSERRIDICLDIGTERVRALLNSLSGVWGADAVVELGSSPDEIVSWSLVVGTAGVVGVETEK